MKITQIEQIAVEIPYLERVREHLRKGWNLANRITDDELQANRSEFERQWRESSPPTVETSIYRVHTDEGNVGIGEGAGIPEDKIQTYLGRSPFEFIMDDTAGPLQIAFYDLMGQAVGLPMARMFGPCQESAPIAYWSQCFPPEVLQEEVKIALEGGFRVHKFKRRAHTDVVEQVQAIAEVAPADYELTIDANTTFGTVERAPLLRSAVERISPSQVLGIANRSGRCRGVSADQERTWYPIGDPLWLTIPNDFTPLACL